METIIWVAAVIERLLLPIEPSGLKCILPETNGLPSPISYDISVVWHCDGVTVTVGVDVIELVGVVELVCVTDGDTDVVGVIDVVGDTDVVGVVVSPIVGVTDGDSEVVGVVDGDNGIVGVVVLVGVVVGVIDGDNEIVGVIVVVGVGVTLTHSHSSHSLESWTIKQNESGFSNCGGISIVIGKSDSCIFEATVTQLLVIIHPSQIIILNGGVPCSWVIWYCKAIIN